MDRIGDFTAFLAIAEQGGQTAAARHLGRSLQAINRSLASLERSVGVELVSRTTRRSRPTESGLAFYWRVRPALSEINEAKHEASSRRPEPSGVLRISAPVLFAPAYVVPASATSSRSTHRSRSTSGHQTGKSIWQNRVSTSPYISVICRIHASRRYALQICERLCLVRPPILRSTVGQGVRIN
jgi:hypothetical protein